MVDINLDQLAGVGTGGPSVPSLVSSLGGSEDWISKFERVLSGVKELFAMYQQMKPQQAEPKDLRTVMRQRHQEVIAEKGENTHMETPNQGPQRPDEVGALIQALIRAFSMYESMGKGNEPIGQAIMSLPLTVSQVRQYLEKYNAVR